MGKKNENSNMQIMDDQQFQDLLTKSVNQLLNMGTVMWEGITTTNRFYRSLERSKKKGSMNLNLEDGEKVFLFQVDNVNGITKLAARNKKGRWTTDTQTFQLLIDIFNKYKEIEQQNSDNVEMLKKINSQREEVVFLYVLGFFEKNDLNINKLFQQQGGNDGQECL